MPDTRFDVAGFIIAFENGELDRDQIVEGFQHLVDTGLAWQLQGAYGRTATALIEQGEVTRPLHSTIQHFRQPKTS